MVHEYQRPFPRSSANVIGSLKVEFGAAQHMGIGDVVLARVQEVDECHNVVLTMKGVRLRRLNQGSVHSVPINHIDRIRGEGNATLQRLREACDCRIIVWENGKVWVDGDVGHCLPSDSTDSRIRHKNTFEAELTALEKMLKKRWCLMADMVMYNYYATTVYDWTTQAWRNATGSIEAGIPRCRWFCNGNPRTQCGCCGRIRSYGGPSSKDSAPRQSSHWCTLQHGTIFYERQNRPGFNRRSRDSEGNRWSAWVSRSCWTHPRSKIRVEIEILAAEAGTGCVGITAAAVALADAGIPMRDLMLSRIR